MIIGGTIGLTVCAAAVTSGGWFLGTGIIRAARNGLDSGNSLLYAAGGGLLLVLGVVFTVGAWTDLGERQRWPLPLPTVLLGATTCALLGLGLADRTPQPLFLAPVPVAVLLAAVWTPRLWARRRQVVIRQWRRREHGLTVRGTITDLEGTGLEDHLKLTVTFTAADGIEYAEQATRKFPSYDLPRRGDGVTVRYLPEDPRYIEIEDVERAQAPHLLDELERLAALHRAGSLTDGEFTQAKARLLTGQG